MNTKTTCEAILARLTLYLLGDLDAQTQTLIAGHLDQCEACRAYADKLAPTLDVLRAALQDVPNAPLALSDEHRKRIKAAYRQRAAAKMPVKKRKPLLMRFHILEMAAVFVGALMIFSVVVGNFGTHSSHLPAMTCYVVEPEPMEALEGIEEPRSTSVNWRLGGSAAREDALDQVSRDTSGFSITGERTEEYRRKSESGAMVPPSATPEPPAPGWRGEGERPREPAPGNDSGVATSAGVIMDGRNAESAPVGGGGAGTGGDKGNAVYYRSLPEAPVPPAPTEVKMDISADMPSLPTDSIAPQPQPETSVNGSFYSAPQSPAKPLARQSDGFLSLSGAESAQQLDDFNNMSGRALAPVLSDELNVPVDSPAAVAPEEKPAKVQSANFDSVTIVKSPVVMGGMPASSSGVRREVENAAFSDGRDVPIEIVNKQEAHESRFRINAPAASGPVGKAEADKEVPVLGDIPVIGRLMKAGRALPAGEGREREGAKRLEKKSRKDSGTADFIAIEGADSARSEEELDDLRIQAEELRKIVADLSGPISGKGSESKSKDPGAGDFLTLTEDRDASPEVEREELRRVVKDLRGQIVDMRGQLSDLQSGSASVAFPAGDFVALEGGKDAGVASGKDSAAFVSSDSKLPRNDLSAALKDRLQNIRLPEVDFRQAKLEDVVAFYNNQLVEFDGSDDAAKVPVLRLDSKPESDSFANGPGDGPWSGNETLVTFSALDISALETLQYAADIAGMSIKQDGNTIQIVPKSAASSARVEETPDVFSPRFKAAGVNPLVPAAVQAFSTFSIDVDTASYTVSRNYMLGGHLPPPEAVRTEEFVNFFDYAYDPPVGKTFRVAAEIAPSRFGRGLHLLKLGVKGRRLGREEQRQASLTILVDSSGSMNQPDRLGLVRTALELLLAELADTDQVAIIQFDNRARLVLAHTPVAQRETILRALGAIQCGGGTNLEAGLGQAYEQAAKAFISRGENRILLMSDGVVNLGETATDGIVKRIEANRRQGLYLSVFGFGMGIYDDAMLKELASKGNGAYAFIDSQTEARRVFVDDLSATLNTIAEDVKIQIEFNPKRVNQYRQLGYEQRQLTKEQFRDDTVDAGEVGSGQSVTALYELDLAPVNQPVPYALQSRLAPDVDDWLAVARVRYRRVDNGKIEEIEQRITASDILSAFDSASPRFRLAAGAAAFAEILRGSPFVQGVAFDDVAAVLRPVALDLHLDQRIRELVQMVETAGGLAR